MENGQVVEAYEIIGCNQVVIRAWELTVPFSVEGGHSSITTFDKVWYGLITSRSLPKSMEDVPVGKHRSELVKTFQFCNKSFARVICQKAYPWLIGREFWDGECVLTKRDFERLSGY